MTSTKSHARFIEALARAAAAAARLCSSHRLDTVVLSGGVFQNSLLLRDARSGLARSGLRVWTNHHVPANDGGLSLGQAAAAVCAKTERA